MRNSVLVTTRYPRQDSCRKSGGGTSRFFASHGFRITAPALLLSGASLVLPPLPARADDTAEDLKQLRAAIQKELADLKKREQKLHQEFLRLDQKSQLLDDQLRKLRAAGAGPGTATPTAPVGGGVPLAAAVNPSRPAGT